LSNKKPNSVVITDPVSQNHVVRLYPQQEFVLQLSEDNGNTSVEWSSEWFILKEQGTNAEGQKTWTFSQPFDLSKWAEIGRCHLGEVMVMSEKSKELIGLQVVLESVKHEILTVINPSGTILKVGPEQVIEVVLFSDKLPADGKFDPPRIMPGTDQITYENTWSQLLDPTEKDAILFPNSEQLIRRCMDDKLKEMHFWFAPNSVTKMSLARSKAGQYQAGKINFSVGDPKLDLKYSLGLLLHMKHDGKAIGTDAATKVGSYEGTIPLADEHKKHHSPIVIPSSKKKKTDYSTNHSSVGNYAQIERRPVELQELEGGLAVGAPWTYHHCIWD
jgi:hypothetical protein